jgi:hypothetical protein
VSLSNIKRFTSKQRELVKDHKWEDNTREEWEKDVARAEEEVKKSKQTTFADSPITQGTELSYFEAEQQHTAAVSRVHSYSQAHKSGSPVQLENGHQPKFEDLISVFGSGPLPLSSFRFVPSSVINRDKRKQDTTENATTRVVPAQTKKTCTKLPAAPNGDIEKGLFDLEEKQAQECDAQNKEHFTNRCQLELSIADQRDAHETKLAQDRFQMIQQQADEQSKLRERHIAERLELLKKLLTKTDSEST